MCVFGTSHALDKCYPQQMFVHSVIRLHRRAVLSIFLTRIYATGNRLINERLVYTIVQQRGQTPVRDHVEMKFICHCLLHRT